MRVLAIISMAHHSAVNLSVKFPFCCRLWLWWIWQTRCRAVTQEERRRWWSGEVNHLVVLPCLQQGCCTVYNSTICCANQNQDDSSEASNLFSCHVLFSDASMKYSLAMRSSRSLPLSYTLPHPPTKLSACLTQVSSGMSVQQFAQVHCSRSDLMFALTPTFILDKNSNMWSSLSFHAFVKMVENVMFFTSVSYLYEGDTL